MHMNSQKQNNHKFVYLQITNFAQCNSKLHPPQLNVSKFNMKYQLIYQNCRFIIITKKKH